MATQLPRHIPEPQIQFTSAPAVVEQGGYLMLGLVGTLRDPLVDQEANVSSDAITEICVTMGDESAGSLAATVSAASRDLWRPHARLGRFEGEVLLPSRPGIHGITVRTAANAAGVSGQSEIMVLVREQALPAGLALTQPGAGGAGSVGILTLTFDRLEPDIVRAWAGQGEDPPEETWRLERVAGEPEQYQAVIGEVVVTLTVDWPVGDPGIQDQAPAVLALRWVGGDGLQLRGLMHETTSTSDRYVLALQVPLAGAADPVPGVIPRGPRILSGEVLSVATQIPAWIPLTLRVHGISDLDNPRVNIGGISRALIVHEDAWYVADGEHPAILAPVAGPQGSVQVRLPGEGGTAMIPVPAYTALEARFEGADVAIELGRWGLEEIAVGGGGTSEPRLTTYAHHALVTPRVQIDHGQTGFTADGSMIRVSGWVVDPLDVLAHARADQISGTGGRGDTGSEAGGSDDGEDPEPVVTVTVDDVPAELTLESRGHLSDPGRGGRWRWEALIPRGQNPEGEYIQVVARNAFGGVSRDRFLRRGELLSRDIPEAMTWPMATRFVFGPEWQYQGLLEEGTVVTFAVVGGGSLEVGLVRVHTNSGVMLATTPVVLSRLDPYRAFAQTLAPFRDPVTGIFLEVPSLTADIRVVVNQSALPATKRWRPWMLRGWNQVGDTWQRVFEQAGVVLAGDGLPPTFLAEPEDEVRPLVRLQVRNLIGQQKSELLQMGSGRVLDQVFGLQGPQTHTVDLDTFYLGFGANEVAVPSVVSLDNLPAPGLFMNAFVMDSTYPVMRTAIPDLRANYGLIQPGSQRITVPQPWGRMLQPGHVIMGELRPQIDVTSPALHEFLIRSGLKVVGINRWKDDWRPDEYHLVLWLLVESEKALAWAEIVKDAGPLFIDIGGGTDPSALMTERAKEMKAALDVDPGSFTTELELREWMYRHAQAKVELDREFANAQDQLVRSTFMALPNREYLVLDCRYQESNIEALFHPADEETQRVLGAVAMAPLNPFMAGAQGNLEKSRLLQRAANTRLPFELGYNAEFGLRSDAMQRAQRPTIYGLSRYRYLAHDRAAKQRSSTTVDPSQMFPLQVPRVQVARFDVNQAQQFASWADKDGIVFVVHGFNNGNGTDGDEAAAHAVVDMGIDGNPHRMLVQYWPVMEQTLRTQQVITPNTVVVHVWWTSSINPIGDFPALDGAFFNADKAAAHFTGVDRLAGFVRAMTTELVQTRAVDPVTQEPRPFPITIIAESLGNRATASAFRELGADPEFQAFFGENSRFPMRNVMIHPAMRQIDLAGNWMQNPVEEEERRLGVQTTGPDTPFVHPYPESPLRGELGLLASADPVRCRSFLAFSGTDKAGLAFLYGQADNPRTLAYDRDLPNSMLGRVGLYGVPNQVDPQKDPRARTPYAPGANLPNVCSVWIGVNDLAGGDHPGASRDAVGSVTAMDLWHVDLWGWAWADTPYRSRHLFDQNGTLSLPTWDERQYVPRDALRAVDDELLRGGFGVIANVTTPWWHQITIRQSTIERAWRLPKLLVEQGWIEAP